MKPSQILLSILSTFIVLAAVCAVGAGRSSVVRIPSLASFMPERETMADSSLAESSAVSDSMPATRLPDTLAVTTPSTDSTASRKVTELPKALPQTKLTLPSFYAALQGAGKQSVRIVHFGDSQIEEDRISMVLRHRLQERFGGGGIGLIPLVQTIPTYTAKQSIEQDGHAVAASSVKRYLAYGPSAMRLKDGNLYGPMAQVAYIDHPVDVSVELLRDRVPTRDYNRIRILYSDSVEVQLLPDSLEQRRMHIATPTNDSVALAEPLLQDILVLQVPQRSSLIRFSGNGYVYGLSLETSAGVQVDNIPMRGAAGTNFTFISSRQLAAYFRETHTALVIMQFGGNAMPAIRSQAAVTRYTESMRQQIRYVMAAAPKASLLFIGPSDMITVVDGEQMSYPMLPFLDRALAAMVEEEGGAYYSLFRLMGGAGSMVGWRDKGLAGEDMVHFTRAGAKKVGEMLAKQLLEDYDTTISADSIPSVVGDSAIVPSPNDSVNK
ncbi:MAG: hypothetical protein IKO63_03950 [Paludibacteraceae bacterium]|nr:hypothetical protein [Paludibacteraceae bacterium]